MKKVFLTLAMVAFAMAANAQFIIGGQIDYNTTGNNTHYEAIAPITNAFDAPNWKATNFTFAPTVGYALNDKMQVGLTFSYTVWSNTNYGPAVAYMNDKEDWVKTKNSTLGIIPYFRYYFAQAGNFNFFCEASLGFYSTPRFYRHTYDNTVDPVIDNEVNGPSSSTDITLRIVPGVNYRINDKFSADCYIDLAGLAFTHNTTKNYGTLADPDALVTTDTDNSFRLFGNASAQDLNAHLGNFRIGFNYHF